MSASFRFKNNKSEFTLLQRFRELQLNNDVVAVGVLKDFNSRYKNGMTVVDTAIINEFGTDKIPARPFMRMTALTAEKRLNELRLKYIRKILDQKITVKDVLTNLGKFYKNAIKYTLNHADFAANKESTIKRKGEGKRPLRDTNRLIDLSINFKLRQKQ